MNATETNTDLDAAWVVNPADFGLPEGEPLRLKTTKEIAASKIGVGYETLDRKMFDPEKMVPYLADLGAKWARIQTGWSRCETEKGVYDFAWLDAVVDPLIEAGLTPWFNLGYGNILYMPDATHPACVGRVPIYYGDEAVAAWTNFVSALAAHFKDRVTHWEIWNEPNITNFWEPGTSNAPDYVRFVALTAPAIKAAIPEATIIGGATAGYHGTLLDDYLDEGLAEYVDAYSFHPYRTTPELNYDAEIRSYREALARHDADLQLWQGENGCPAVQEGHNDTHLGLYNMNETIHAKWAARRLILDLGVGLDFTSYFHAVDLMAQPYVQSGGVRPPVMMGLVRGEDYTPRPAYHAMRAVCTLFDADTEPAAFPLRFHPTENAQKTTPKIGWVAARRETFLRKGHPLLAYWVPEDPQEATAPAVAALEVILPVGTAWTDPVLVDPLRGRVMPVSPKRVIREGRWFIFDPLPLADYPLILTDRAALG